MKVLKHLPEATVISAFFPMGVFMGYILQYPFVGLINNNHNIQRILNNSRWWPWVAGSVAAILTGLFLYIIKIKTRRNRYDQLYCLSVGMVIFFIAGILFMTSNIPYAAIYMSFIAHGISYIAALSYLNLRMGKTKFRFILLSIPLVFYIFSVAVGSTIVYNQINLGILNNPTGPRNDIIGLLLVISSIWTIGCILILEYNVYYSNLNYKSSLDEDINRENKNLTIFDRKYFMITPTYGNAVPPPQLTVKNSYSRSILLLMFVIISKSTSVMYFYWPFMYIHHSMSIVSLNFNLFSINWFGFAGVTVSTILLIPLTYKIQHLIGIVMKLMYMVILLIIFSYDFWFTREITVMMWLLFLTLGFGYPNCDINILSFTDIKHTEVVLSIGYVVLNITVGALQYITIQTPDLVINSTSVFHLIYPHSIAFLIILLIVFLLGMFIIPKRDYKSLLELQNFLRTLSEHGMVQPSNTIVNTSPTHFPGYGQPGTMPHNFQMANQPNNQQPYMVHVVRQQPSAYAMEHRGQEQQLPPYESHITPMYMVGPPDAVTSENVDREHKQPLY